MHSSFTTIIKVTFLTCLGIILWTYSQGYDLSIDWEVSATGEFIPFDAWTMDNGLLKHSIESQKLLLLENYQGSTIKQNDLILKISCIISWLGVCIVLAGSSYLKRIGFFISIGLFALFINRLNLFEVGLFGIQNRLVLLIPFLAIAAPLIYFNEYQKNVPFTIRLGVLLVISSIIAIGVEEYNSFSRHFIAHSIFSYALCGIIFLLIIVEEPIFAILLLITRTKGSRDNQIHFIVISLIYLGNLTFYYLNKSGYFPNKFFFFDPYILLFITSIISLFTLKFKFEYLSAFISSNIFINIFCGLGIIFVSMIGVGMYQGIDAIQEGFHYFILYFHLGFGVFFFIYLVINFIDALIKGLPVYKIAYREQHFPYVSARLGGLVAALGFYFLSGQEAYNLIRSGYYNYLGNKEIYLGNELLGYEYYDNAAFLGIKTHYPNYMQGFKNLNSGNNIAAKGFFNQASTRFGSAYSLVNYGNLDKEFNTNKVQSRYEEILRKKHSDELKNNLGVIHIEKGNIEAALPYFKRSKSSEEWNEAPVVNKWYTYNRLGSFTPQEAANDFKNGHYGIKSNILVCIKNDSTITFQTKELEKAPFLHKRAYLLNSLSIFKDDTLESIIEKEIESSINGDFNNLLRKSLAIHLYKKGNVNKAFRILDNLQSNASRFQKGEYLDMMGKLALEQGAYSIALSYFDEAIDYGETTSRFSKIEVLATLDRKSELIEEATRIVEIDPGLTGKVNQVLANLEGFEKPERTRKSEVESLNPEELLERAHQNAFDVPTILYAINELDEEYEEEIYHLLVEAIDINDQSPELLQSYIMAALNWNLISYAETGLSRLEPLMEEDAFQIFLQKYTERRKTLEDVSWD